ncbi:hypothetical protein BDW62DRAFT_202854 [Aspergillus aurantiobrunneus]
MVYTILALPWSYDWANSEWGPPYWRNLIFTPDRETADLLFRVLKQNGPSFSKSPLLMRKRPSPQVWVWVGRAGNQIPYEDVLKETINEINTGSAPIKDEYKDRLRGCITIDYRGHYDKADNSIPPIPHLDLPDRIAGRVFTIRDKSDPPLFWAGRTTYPGEGCIALSTCKRSRFRITIQGNTDPETVMVFDDQVSLELLYAGEKGLKALPVNIDDSTGLLRVVGDETQPQTFPFGKLLKGGFIAATHYNDDHTEYPTWVGNSEAGNHWELSY